MIEFAEEESPSGAPAWMATFADLMSLLMCFFVLLLSFSEMDAQKYKLVAGSMKNAFGIQREVLAIQNPSGTAELTENMHQQTSETDPIEQERTELLEDIEMLALETAEDIKKLEEGLKEEIEGGFIELESGFRSITIRIKEKGSFDSGSASLQEEFIPVMTKLQNILIDIDGKITVEGHTDDIDISTPRFASNWDLSSARALSVGHELLRYDLLASERFVISGYADTVPFGSNDTVEGRASNRRVEINIRQPVSQEISAGLQELSDDDSGFLNFFTGIGSASPSAVVPDRLDNDIPADLGQ
jgi:chemotaxis protein MotB